MPRGKIPKSARLHVIAGTFRKDRHGGGGDGGGQAPPDQRLKAKDCPKYLHQDARAVELWAEVLPQLPWLLRVDACCVSMWCMLQAEFERDPGSMRAAKLSILRLLGSDIGLSGAGRARLVSAMVPPAEPGKDKYFD